MALSSRNRSVPSRNLPPWGLWILLALPLLLLLAAGWSWTRASRLRAAGLEALNEPDLAAAEEAFSAAAGHPFGRSRSREGLALVHLSRGELDPARSLLEAAGPSGGRSILEDPAALLRGWLRAGRVDPALAYSGWLGDEPRDPGVLLYRAMALAGDKDPEASRTWFQAFLDQAGKVGVSPYQEEMDLLRQVLEELERGSWACVLSRDGAPGHLYDIESGEALPGAWDLGLLTGSRPAAPDAGFLSADDVRNRVVLTVSRRAQSAAARAFSRRAGGFVLLDAKTGEILAAASLPGRSGERTEVPNWLAFTHQYEPGSIIKLFTLSSAVREDVEMDRLFPLNCRGNDFVLDGQILYDWIPHGTVRDPVHALAVSCNTAFGKLGLMLGGHPLEQELRRWRFGASLENTFVPMEMGQVWKGTLGGDVALARAGMGLGDFTTTALHAAMMAAAIANDGKMPRPSLLRERQSFLGTTTDQPDLPGFDRVSDPRILAPLRRGMEAAVARPEGTASRLADSRVSLAVKTGTAGRKEDGYDAILMGYFPREDPEVAFGMILEGAGLAGVEGAKALDAFLETWHRRGGGVDEVRQGRGR